MIARESDECQSATRFKQPLRLPESVINDVVGGARTRRLRSEFTVSAVAAATAAMKTELRAAFCRAARRLQCFFSFEVLIVQGSAERTAAPLRPQDWQCRAMFTAVAGAEVKERAVLLREQRLVSCGRELRQQ